MTPCCAGCLPYTRNRVDRHAAVDGFLRRSLFTPELEEHVITKLLTPLLLILYVPDSSLSSETSFSDFCGFPQPTHLHAGIIPAGTTAAFQILTSSSVDAVRSERLAASVIN